MSEICDVLGPGPGTVEGQRWDHRDVPRFVVGCDDDEDDMDEVDAGMKSEMFRDEEMEDDDDDELVSCSIIRGRSLRCSSFV